MESSPPSSPNEKLRLMLSYGGHIVPRPHDKTLFYAGGETRLIAVSRTTSLSLTALTTHLAKTLSLTPPFTLKYQLPNHDLDSLISISNDEDLANMLDEYDRPTSSRIRFFLFCGDGGDGGGGGVGAGGGCVGSGGKTEEWFIDALRSSGVKMGSGESILVEDRERDGGVGREREEDSSFGSTNSSSYSPAVRVCGGVGGGGGGDDGVVLGSRYQDVKVVLPSVDSLGSDSSIPSPNFSQQAIVYQDASGFPDLKPVSTNLVENESNISDRSPNTDILTPVQVSGYILSKPVDHPPQSPSPPPPQQPYIHHASPQTHYINQYYPSAVPIATYPTMYQPYVQAHQPVQYHQINKHPYPMYMMPIGQAQNSYAIPQTVTTSQSQVPPNPVMIAPHMVYEGYKPVNPTPEYAPKVYTATDEQHQVVAFPPPNLPSPQPVAVSPLENTNYNSEFEDPMHAQIYKSQPSGPTLPSQLQTTTLAETVMLSESFSQLQVENTKQ